MSVAAARRLKDVGANWYESPETRGRIRSMEGLRGLAVLLVFYTHYHDLLGTLYLTPGTWLFDVSHFFKEIGMCGVDLFFVLSGYLIYAATIKPNLRIPRFWKRRVERLYPTYLAVFAIYLALSWLFPERSNFPGGGLWPNAVTFTASLLMMAGLAPVAPLITVAWSLSFEMFYYLVLPLLILATGMQKWTPSARVVFFLGLAGVYIALFLSGSFLSPGYWSHARMLMFIVGILLYERLKSGPPPAGSVVREPLVGLLFVASLCALVYLQELSLAPEIGKEGRSVFALGKVLVTVVPFYMFNLYAFGSAGYLRRQFEWWPLRWLGNMSYSYYLIHGLVVHSLAIVFQKILPVTSYGPVVYLIAMPPVFIATLAVSTLLFLGVERPLSLQFQAR